MQIPAKLLPPARIAMVLYLMALCYVCFGSHFDYLPDLSEPWLGWIPKDKIIHCILFLPFPLLLYYTIGKRSDTTAFSPWGYALLLMLAGCLLAALTEIGQGITSYRDMSIGDFAADAVGSFLGSLPVLFIDLLKTQHI